MNNIGGSPLGLPYAVLGMFRLFSRGGAEGELPRRGKRSLPGVCPSRRIPGISPYLAGRSGTGPYDIPRTVFCMFCRGGYQPPTPEVSVSPIRNRKAFVNFVGEGLAPPGPLVKGRFPLSGGNVRRPKRVGGLAEGQTDEGNGPSYVGGPFPAGRRGRRPLQAGTPGTSTGTDQEEGHGRAWVVAPYEWSRPSPLGEGAPEGGG